MNQIWAACGGRYNNGPCGLWVGLFIYSKVPELLDTVFLVFQKKRVVFLAWFHHTTGKPSVPTSLFGFFPLRSYHSAGVEILRCGFATRMDLHKKWIRANPTAFLKAY